MRLKFILTSAMLSGLVSLTLSHAPVSAADLDGPAVKKKRIAHHRAHSVRHRYFVPEDPYAYQYEPRGYYPYYRSDYWRSAAYVRYRSRLHYHAWNTRPPHYRFYRSWGYPLRYWPHSKWHAYYQGGHRPWHW